MTLLAGNFVSNHLQKQTQSATHYNIRHNERDGRQWVTIWWRGRNMRVENAIYRGYLCPGSMRQQIIKLLAISDK